jgi:hypothetical protein
VDLSAPRRRTVRLLPVAALLLGGCAGEDDSSYTLYRNGVSDEAARYHVATFDSRDGEKYNQGNCQVAVGLFQSQPGVTTRFWCEKGRYRK